MEFIFHPYKEVLKSDEMSDWRAKIEIFECGWGFWDIFVDIFSKKNFAGFLIFSKILLWWTPITWISREICSPITGWLNGGRNSEVRCHRALILSGACSSRPYASFEWMWTPITWFSFEICSPLIEGINGGRNSEVRCHRALILCEACSSRRYASFEWMWTHITWFPGRYALL